MSVLLYRSLFSKSDWIVAVSMILIMTSVDAQEKKYYFYHSLPYGSESTFNPISLLANCGLDELQAYEYSHSLSQIPWKNGGRNVWLNITAPLPQINEYGWNRFIGNEIIPSSLNTE